jgi:hypothetical protein
VCHVSYGSGSCLPARESSDVPHALQLQILPPCREGLQCAMCPTALDPASLQGRAPVCHVCYSFRSCLPTGEGSGAPCVLQLRILRPCRRGLRSTACPTTLDPASLQWRAPERRVCRGSGSVGSAPERPVSHDSGSCLPTGRTPVPPLHALRFHVDRGPQA